MDIVPYPGILAGQPVTFGGGSTITIDVDLDTEGTAKTLTVEAVPVGPGAHGTITTTPGPIDCGDVCSAIFPTDGEVSLMAVPNGDSVFVGWSGDADCADGALTMTGDRSCTGAFEVDPAVFAFGDGFETGDLSAWDQANP